ncbi:hypothetical protein D3C71_1659780 [compost metagenome]
MPDMDYQIATFSRSVQQPDGVVGGLIGAVERPFAAGEIVVLDIDDDQRLLAHAASCGSSRGMTLVIGFVLGPEDWRDRHNDGKN